MENAYRDKVVAAVMRLHEAERLFKEAQAELDGLLAGVGKGPEQTTPETPGSEPMTVYDPKMRQMLDAISRQGSVWRASQLLRIMKLKKPQQLSKQLAVLSKAGAIEKVGPQLWRTLAERFTEVSKSITG